MNLATAISIDPLASAAYPEHWTFKIVGGVIAILIFIGVGVAAEIVERKGNSRKARKMIVFSVPIIYVPLVLALVIVKSADPAPADAISETFATAYPNLTLRAADTDCIKSMIEPGEDNPKFCLAVRNTDDGVAKIEYANDEGKFTITSLTDGKVVTSDADIVYDGRGANTLD
jgi:hypothetical protein